MAWLSLGILKIKFSTCPYLSLNSYFKGTSNLDLVSQLVTNGVIKDERIRVAFELTDRGNLISVQLRILIRNF